MDFDKRTILAFILIGFIIVVTQTNLYRKTLFPNSFREAQQRKEELLKKQRIVSDLDSSKLHQSDSEVIGENTLFQNDEKQKENKKDVEIRINNKQFHEKEIYIETPLIRTKISTRGASIVSWQLKKYKTYNQSFVEMIPKNAFGNLGISFAAPDTLIDTSTLEFSCSIDSIILQTGEQKSVEFGLELNNGSRILKRYTFFSDRYDFEFEVHLINMGELISGRNYNLDWKSGLASTEKRLNDDMYYAKAYVSASGNTESFKKIDEKAEIISGQDIDWTALRTKYFVMAISPDERKGLEVSVKGEGINTNGKKEKWKKYNVALKMPFLNDNLETDRFLIYCGPLDYDIIKEYNRGFESMMDFGWKIIEPFSKAVLWSLKAIHRFIPNYGIVLLIFSVLIKLLVYPLTHKSYQSMQKMQALQPKMAELKEKYGKDPQRLNQETMKMYKKYGVNPMGGCLPMLLQMPLLYSLFIIFRATIELRGEGFAFWITDLSSPDTIATLPFVFPLYGNSVNVLPLLMGATMFIQQKMSVQDPKQKMMAYMMPIFFTLLFNNFPSGLTLYYTLFNVLSIAQQKIVSDKNKGALAPMESFVDKRKKGGSPRKKV